MKHGGLFNGIGGFQLAASWLGWDNVFSCEIDDFCNHVTKYHFPNCKQHYDIKTTDFKEYKGQIDILTGGFPCQPFSVAGKRLGTEDDRSLWGEMYRAVKEIQPCWVVAENVPGIINWNEGVVFEQVHTDLENAGYEVQAFIIPAASVNAPHRRERVWFVAYNPNTRTEKVQQRRKDRIYGLKDVANTTGKRGIQGKQNKQSEFTYKNGGTKRITADTSHGKSRGLPNESKTQRTQYSYELFRCQYTIPNWNNFPTQSPICSGDDGIPRELDGITFPKWRRESIKAYGNAIVPQVAFQIFKAIQDYETITPKD